MMKQVVVFNDIAGIAACTLGVAMPILSVCDCKAYPVPTAVFSSSTRIEGVQFASLSAFLPKVEAHWQTVDMIPDAMLTGCFADADGVAPVLAIAERFKKQGTLLVVDPVMGDDGYVFASPELQQGFRRLVALADITCPNFTELCVLLGEDYAAMDKLSYEDKIAYLTANASRLGVPNVVVTGIRNGDEVVNFVYEKGRVSVFAHPFHHKGVCGTGDMFSNILLTRVLYGRSVAEGVQFAGQWIEQLTRNMSEHPERGLYIGGERLLALRKGILEK